MNLADLRKQMINTWLKVGDKHFGNICHTSALGARGVLDDIRHLTKPALWFQMYYHVCEDAPMTQICLKGFSNHPPIPFGRGPNKIIYNLLLYHSHKYHWISYVCC